MAYIEPNTIIRFLSDVPLDPDYENTLYFNNVNAQTDYFVNKTRRVFTDQSYQRKTRGWLRVGWNADVNGGSVMADMYASTYMMFKNSNFENKWFYAFVDKVEYVNNNCVDIQYHIDVMQTWHFDYELNQCFIERQHSETDLFGENTIPEQLEHGSYIDENLAYRDVDTDTLWTGPHYRYTPAIMLITTFDNNGDYFPGRVIPGWGNRGNYFSGVNCNLYDLSAASIAALNTTLEALTADNKIMEGVLGLVMVPGSMFNSNGTSKNPNTISLAMGNNYYQYTPRNKKLLCYPYNFLYVTNNQGTFMECKWEDFENAQDARFMLWANFSSSPGMVAIPRNYKNIANNDDEKITLAGFPLCSWNYDTFKAWMAQNTGAIVSGFLGGVIKGVEAAVTRNPFQAASLIGQTFDALGQVYDHYTLPPQNKGDNNGNLIYQSSLMTFSFYKKHIKPEYAKIIDDYFDMYGYAIHRHGVPNRAARPCYTYIKTIGCSIHGNIPSDDIVEIQNLFNRGIRFWKSTAVFGNYDPTVNNNAV